MSRIFGKVWKDVASGKNFQKEVTGVSDKTNGCCIAKPHEILNSIAGLHRFCKGARSCQLIPRINFCDGSFDCFDREGNFDVIHCILLTL